MTTQDVLNIVLIIGFLIITGCVVYFTYYFVQALKSVTNLTDSIDETAENIKNKIQMRALAALPAILISLASKIVKKRRG